MEQPNTLDTNQSSKSGHNDYFIFIIGLILVLSSNWSDLGKKMTIENATVQEQQLSNDQAVLVKGITSLRD